MTDDKDEATRTARLATWLVERCVCGDRRLDHDDFVGPCDDCTCPKYVPLHKETA